MQLYVRLLTLALAGILLIGCAWTMSPARRQRISDCLRRCEAQQGASPMAAPDSHDTYRDTRSPCERECHSTQ